MKRVWILLFCAFILAGAALVTLAPAPAVHAAAPDPRLAKAFRFEQGLWTYVHLEGDPRTVGFQHGYLLAPEIADALAYLKLEKQHSTGKEWEWYRNAAHEVLWPHIDPEYQMELDGIAEGVRAHGVPAVDRDDIVALNAMEELGDYYLPYLQ